MSDGKKLQGAYENMSVVPWAALVSLWRVIWPTGYGENINYTQ